MVVLVAVHIPWRIIGSRDGDSGEWGLSRKPGQLESMGPPVLVRAPAQGGQDRSGESSAILAHGGLFFFVVGLFSGKWGGGFLKGVFCGK